MKTGRRRTSTPQCQPTLLVLLDLDGVAPAPAAGPAAAAGTLACDDDLATGAALAIALVLERAAFGLERLDLGLDGAAVAALALRHDQRPHATLNRGRFLAVLRDDQLALGAAGRVAASTRLGMRVGARATASVSSVRGVVRVVRGGR